MMHAFAHYGMRAHGGHHVFRISYLVCMYIYGQWMQINCVSSPTRPRFRVVVLIFLPTVLGKCFGCICGMDSVPQERVGEDKVTHIGHSHQDLRT